ncbi:MULTISPECIES: bifunctional diguanylate cyclase/phosphodiesterase [Rahnella]|jgi:diguanylate cyclase (GGDEF)-like protein|uniref:putative bifunctional diguanylate cyclase/phosphodiesterase n=1 Tax=Rahnella TaxID=34037 RepID=UPI000568F559|nr:MULTISPECIES: bifunctional diguanylate cyclase/phosphodiesterase [Rahnella]QQN36060.1 bifunctional diguanylate cyclase/phosphodiesterase [Rahnella aceris]
MLKKLRNKAKVELYVWIGILIATYLFSLYFNMNEVFYYFFKAYEVYNLDEVFIALNITGFLGLIFSFVKIKAMEKEIARRMEAEKNFHWVECHDPVTGLPNTIILNSTIAQYNHENKSSFGVFTIEINRLKDINDIFGHDYHDEIFKIVAERLLNIFPGCVYKLAADDFLVLRPNIDKTDLTSLSGRVMRSLCSPVNLDGFTFNISANIGISRSPEDSCDLKKVIQQSDCAMHVAKKAGREQIRAFSASMEESLLSMAQLERDFKSALKNKVFVSHYQPLVDLKSEKIIGFEALARWEISAGKFIPPSKFIALAEDTGAITELTEYLLREACLEALKWPSDKRLSFNLSPLLLCDKNLKSRIIGILDDVGFPPEQLEIEVTESALFSNRHLARYTLKRLRDAGVKIALDDFGTGYSSLSQLCDFPFDTLKIDKSFIDTFQTNEKQNKIVCSILSLANALNVKVVAEGIEYKSQLIILQELGCDIGQGYFLGKPVPAANIHKSIKSPLTEAEKVTAE